MFWRLWTLILKELKSELQDPNTRRVLILPVILQIALFPFAATLEVLHTHLGIYNQDSGAVSVELTQRFAKSTAFTYVKIFNGMDEVKKNIDNQEALTVINFPANFSRNIESGNQATLQIVIDGRRSNAAQIVNSYIGDIIENYQNDLSTTNKKNNLPSKIFVKNWFNPNLEYRWFVLPTFVALMTTVGCLAVTVMSVAREREQGTFEQLLVTPLTPISIMIGKVVPAIIIALIQASIVLFASIFLYQIPFQGSLMLLYFCILCYGLALSGIGLLISSLCSTQQQAFLGVFGFLMPSILLSGFIAPIENIPEPLQSITWLNPVRHFVVISKGIYLKGFDLALVWNDLWPLLVIGFISLFLAYLKFRQYSR